MTSNGIHGPELAPDGLDLVLQLERHLASNPEDHHTREALLQVQAAPHLPEPLPGWVWSQASPPKPRSWLIEDWLPAGRVTLLAGPGGAGKSRLALQLAAGIASGGGNRDSWIDAPLDALRLGNMVSGEGAPVVYTSWEDEEEEFDRRLTEISGSGTPWVVPERLKRLQVVNLAQRGAIWAPIGSRHISSLACLTETGDLLRQRCLEWGARLLVLDPLAAAYAGDENARGLVRAFVADWDGWGQVNNCGVLLVAHPPKSGSSGYSGSTDWEAAVRSRWELDRQRRGPPPTGRNQQDIRPEGWQLTLPKRNYGPELKPLALELDFRGGLRWKATWWDEGDEDAKEY